MIIKLLIATPDKDYSEYLSSALSERYAQAFTVGVCSSMRSLNDMLDGTKYDVVLLESKFADAKIIDSISLPLVLVDESGFADESGFKTVKKYQRISMIVGEILENYAQISKRDIGSGIEKARITAVWSPSGGTGKTTVALAYAANKILHGKQATYLSLENFSSTSVYFQENGKSISKVFEKLDSLDSNVQMFLTGIRQQDSGSGILYFCEPENYDDINILTQSDIEILLNACATGVDELIVDLSSQCDERVQKIFEIADTVLLICDLSSTSQTKLRQFINQHNIFKQIQSKAVLVNNKGAKIIEESIEKTVQLPHVQSTDPISTFKALSGINFE